MPRLSDSMEEGTVLKWLVDLGGEVTRGQPLVEIETDKANMTYEADTDGVLVEVLAKEGDTLPVGEAIARIGEPGEAPSGGNGQAAPAASEPAPPRATEPAPQRASQTAAPPASDDAPPPASDDRVDGGGGDGDGGEAAPVAPPARAPAADGGRVRASPVARRMAGELGVELTQLEGTGPGGRIVKADIEAARTAPAPASDRAAPAPERAPQTAPAEEPQPATAAEAPAPAPRAAAAAPVHGEAGPRGEPEVQELSRLQRTVSRRMAESKATAPDFALEVDVDMTLCIELRERLKQQADPAPSFNDMIVKAAALALREHPRVNAAYRDGAFELYPRVNVGVAVAARDALVVPVIPDADQKSLGEISRQARRLIERVRDGQITPPELSGGTFVVSNLGMFGIDRFTAIINPPQAAIMAVGALRKRPAVDEHDRVVARDLMTLTLVCDHRILYGADGAPFLARVREMLEQPLSLAL
jgi:pyruvate dehydrogenase E2 component (dihydrolipoamide acetyltransferase)